MAAAPIKPWDARVALALVRPLRHTAVHPNHLTTARLGVGVGAAACLAAGGTWLDVGAGLFALSTFLDHTDGELARLTGKTSRAGHLYDLVSDAVVLLACFIGTGFGLRGELGAWGPWLGSAAGAAIAGIFAMFQVTERAIGDKDAVLGSRWGFEAEDSLYLIAPMTWLGLLAPFLVIAAVGAPLFALWFWRRHRASWTRAENAAG